MARGLGSIQRKLLVLLAGGVSLVFASGSPKAYARTLRAIGREWDKVNRYVLAQAIRRIYVSKLVDFRERKDGTVAMAISDAGRKRVIMFNTETMRIKAPLRWDRRWRMVIFDIPQHLKQARDALRFQLKRLGFHQLQKSVFVHPYPCGDEIDFLVELFDVRPFVRQIVAERIDNELHLKKHFDLV